MTSTRPLWIAMWLLPLAQTTAQPGAAQPQSPPTVTLQFPGGPLDTYVEALKSAAPRFNIVLAVPEARQITLPPIRLDGVEICAAVKLVQGDYTLPDGGMARIQVNEMGPKDGDGTSKVYKISREPILRHERPAEVRVWNISDLLAADRKAEDVLTAVETAVGLLAGPQEARIRFHAETSLVVASGDVEQLTAIERVIAGLRQGLRSGKGSRVEREQRLDALIAALLESAQGPQAGTSLQQAGGDQQEGQIAELLATLQEELRERDRTIKRLQQQLSETERK